MAVQTRHLTEERLQLEELEAVWMGQRYLECTILDQAWPVSRTLPGTATLSGFTLRRG